MSGSGPRIISSKTRKQGQRGCRLTSSKISPHVYHLFDMMCRSKHLYLLSRQTGGGLVYAPPQVLQTNGCVCHPALRPVLLEQLQTAGPLRSTGITRLHRYCGPIRHPLAFSPLPGFASYRAYLAAAISRRGEEGFSSCLACPCHRAVASTPPK